MELKNVVCTSCGGSARISADKSTAKCEYCLATFVVEIAEKLAKVETDKTKEIKNLRLLLKTAADGNDVRNISAYASKLLQIIPDDYSAKYFYAYAENALGKHNYISDFYKTPATSHTAEELAVILKHISEYGALRDRVMIGGYIMALRGIDNAAAYNEYGAAFARREKLEHNYENVPRDVFICHRSDPDKDKALAVLEALEGDSHKCWISYRNLRPNTINYKEDILKAIESCKIFLALKSRDAMYSDDVKWEVETARSLNKSRVEFVLDTSERTPLFKAFFDGCQWVEGYTVDRNSLANLRNRIFAELEKLKQTGKKPNELDEIKEMLKKQQAVPAAVAAAPAADAPSAGGVSVQALLKKAKLQIEDGDFKAAAETCDKISDIDVENGELWLYMLLIASKHRNLKELSESKRDFTNDGNYIKAARFAGENLKSEITNAVNKAHTYYTLRKKLDKAAESGPENCPDCNLQELRNIDKEEYDNYIRKLYDECAQSLEYYEGRKNT